jgi:Mn2+/Fe2+ NRAMP family transporter
VVDRVTPPNGNGNGRHGLLANVSDKLIRALPPAMVLLVLLNIVFLGTTMYLVQNNADYRNQLLTKIVEGCLTQRQ